MALVGDLLYHEYEVINGFFSRGAAWVATEHAAASAELQSIISPNNDYVEHLLCHPNGPVELEQIVCRTTINELNALVEVALQESLENKSGSFFVESRGRFVIGAQRDVLLRELLSYGVHVTEFPNYGKLIEIKELSEGFKHRQRGRPLPKIKNGQWETPQSIFPTLEDQQFYQYEITLSDVSKYLDYVLKFLEHCRSESLI